MGILDKLTSESAIKVPHHLALSNGKKESENRKISLFPKGAFPQKVQSAISATNATLLYPEDFTGTAILTAAAGAIGCSLRAVVKNGYALNPVLYGILVGRPGSVKSHPVSSAISPLLKRDQALFKMFKDEMRRYEASLRSKDESQKMDQPILKKHIVSDVTTEALSLVLSNNRRGLLAHMDEAVKWFKDFNRYRSGSDQEYWLSNWSGKPIISDRKSSASIYIANPCVSFIGTIQPMVLSEITKENRGGNGFIDRILFSFPEDLTINPWSDYELDESILREYDTIITRLLDIQTDIDDSGEIIPIDLRFSTDGFKRLKEWQAHNANIANTSDDPQLGGIHTKLEIYCIRFSLILQALYWASEEDDLSIIKLRAVEGGIQLAEYFRVNAIRVFDTMNHIDPLQSLPENQKRFINALPYTFKTSEGQEIALRYEIPERTYKRFLKDETLFLRTKHGVYEKLQ